MAAGAHKAGAGGQHGEICICSVQCVDVHTSSAKRRNLPRETEGPKGPANQLASLADRHGKIIFKDVPTDVKRAFCGRVSAEIYLRIDINLGASFSAETRRRETRIQHRRRSIGINDCCRHFMEIDNLRGLNGYGLSVAEARAAHPNKVLPLALDLNTGGIYTDRVGDRIFSHILEAFGDGNANTTIV